MFFSWYIADFLSIFLSISRFVCLFVCMRVMICVCLASYLFVNNFAAVVSLSLFCICKGIMFHRLSRDIQHARLFSQHNSWFHFCYTIAYITLKCMLLRELHNLVMWAHENSSNLIRSTMQKKDSCIQNWIHMK